MVTAGVQIPIPREIDIVYPGRLPGGGITHAGVGEELPVTAAVGALVQARPAAVERRAAAGVDGRVTEGVERDRPEAGRGQVVGDGRPDAIDAAILG